MGYTPTPGNATALTIALGYVNLYVNVTGSGGSGAGTYLVLSLGSVNTSGTAVAWQSGTDFSILSAGMAIQIAGVSYPVSSVTNSHNLVLATSAGTQTGASWSAGTLLTAADV